MSLPYLHLSSSLLCYDLAILLCFPRCHAGVAKTLFEGSEETPGLKGLGIIPGMVGCFDPTKVSLPTHHKQIQPSPLI